VLESIDALIQLTVDISTEVALPLPSYHTARSEILNATSRLVTEPLRSVASEYNATVVDMRRQASVLSYCDDWVRVPSLFLRHADGVPSRRHCGGVGDNCGTGDRDLQVPVRDVP
jgi:hypothetical protein